MKVRDYLRSHEGILNTEGTDTRVRVNGLDIVIRRMPQFEVRRLLNGAVAIMLDRLQKNVQRSALRFEQNALEQVSLRVAVHNLYLYMMWDEYSLKYRGTMNPLEPADLLRYHVSEQVMRHCQKLYNGDYRARAAALLGFSSREFARWEAQRLELKMRTDSARYSVV